jgi:hypothetical protein
MLTNGHCSAFCGRSALSLLRPFGYSGSEMTAAKIK